MTSTVGFSIVVAVVLGLMALVCGVASASLRGNKPLALLAFALGNATAQTLFLTFAPGTMLEYASAMAMAPLGFWLARQTIVELTGERRLSLRVDQVFAVLCALATVSFALNAPFFVQSLLVQAACALTMVDATVRVTLHLRRAPINYLLLVGVAILAALRLARLPLLAFYYGPEASFAMVNGGAVEMALLAGESLLTMLIISTVVAAIIADTISTFRHQSERDSLTGLLNQRAIDLLAEQPLPHGGAVIFCDIDHFKQVNDRFGHQAGDDVICAFAAIARRTGYPAARIGGEEFAVLMPGHSAQDALDLAEMMRARFHAMSHAGLPADFRVSASFGVTSVERGDRASNQFANADDALYMAKNSGRNRVVRYDRGVVPAGISRRSQAA